ncbi:MAG: TIGR04084 family radical SAM/SPASM domain-containing protein [Candidatus Bathyarchaeia archaeon]
MRYYVTLTTDCNLRCEYCYGKCLEDMGAHYPLEVDCEFPSRISYGLEELADFLERDPDPVLIFYGGEPLLEAGLVKRMMDSIPASAFIIQTNGLLLNYLEREYANRFHTILVSLDGDEGLTDSYRGAGTYRRVVENVRALKEGGFKGELIARMTVAERTEIYDQVLWLLFNEECPFPAVHWQLDALFGVRDYWRRRFSEWAERSYNPQIERLAKFWVDYMEREGHVLRIYPFLGLMRSMLRGERAKLRCGAGWMAFNIRTDGKITPCPVMAGTGPFLGDIRRTDPKELQDAVQVSEPCPSCDIFGLCGGRCLYANLTKLWGDKGFAEVCGTVRNLVGVLEDLLPRVREMIADGIISLDDFEYMECNSCEIIP